MSKRQETIVQLVECLRDDARRIARGAVCPNLPACFRDYADRIEAAHDREVQDALDTGGLVGASKAKTDGVALVPARIALNLCRAIGERDRQKQEAFVRELADWLSANGHDDLGGYALAQIGAIPTKGEEG